MSRKKKPENFMDYVPRPNRTNEVTVSKDGNVTVHIKWRGPYHKIATVLFHRPSVSHIDLDDIGSFIWKQMDGERTVQDIYERMRQKYPNMEQPLERLIKYIRILHNNKLIVYNIIDEKKD